MDVNVWQGVFTPTGTPAAINRRLHTDIVKILEMPDIKNPIVGGGYEMGGECGGVCEVRARAAGDVGEGD
jgi:hypothetical protein